jgi:hypothetical protein
MIIIFHSNVFFFAQEFGVDVQLINGVIIVFNLAEIKTFYFSRVETLNPAEFMLMRVYLSMTLHCFQFEVVTRLGQGPRKIIH